MGRCPQEEDGDVKLRRYRGARNWERKSTL